MRRSESDKKGSINNDVAFLMSYVQGEDRGQAALLPAVIEDYVASDAPVRAIDAFVDGLDVRARVWAVGPGSERTASLRSAGPAEALSLWLPQRSALVARLERECSRNVEVMWLLRRRRLTSRRLPTFDATTVQRS